MAILLLLISPFFAVMTLILQVYAIRTLYSRIRRKGYRLPGATLVLLAGFALGILSMCVVVSAFPKQDPNQKIGLLFFVIFFFVIICLPFLVCGATIILFIWVAPHRNPRVSGLRHPRFPFAAAGWTLIGLGAVFCVYAIVSGIGEIWEAVLLFLGIGAYGAHVISMRRRVNAQVSFEDIARNDPRAPVLYLRPFDQESYFFDSRYQDFEAYFGPDLTARIGPFFALGSPEDYMPRPGAIRTYVNDTEWKEHFMRLAGRSACIVTAVASSDNVRFEFEYLRHEGLQRKLFVVTRPSSSTSYWLYGIRPDTWLRFAENLARLGYDIPSDPGRGAVMAFDASGKGITLTTGAFVPGDYVEPIRTFIIDSLGYSPEHLDPPRGREPQRSKSSKSRFWSAE